MKEKRKRKGIMLATPATETLVSALFKNGYAFIQPKLNGERCLCILSYAPKKTKLLSSTELEFSFLNSIKEEAFQFFLPQLGEVALDGELYSHGMPREQIHSIASRKTTPSVEEEKLQFHVFDIKAPELSQEKRFQLIRKLNSSEKIKKVKTLTIFSVEEATAIQSNFLAQGYEGAILRAPFGFYEEKRSKNVLKIKPTGQDCYEIVDVVEEVSKENFLKGSLGAFVVKDKEGHVFKVGSGKFLTRASREYFWNCRDTLPGKFLLVKYSLTKNASGIPSFAVAEDILSSPVEEEEGD